VYGRYLFAVGRNEVAARYSGVNADRITAGAYVVCGLPCGFCRCVAVFLHKLYLAVVSRKFLRALRHSQPAVLGGCSLRGGEGSVIGILIGTALLQVLQNLVNLLGIPSSLNFAVMGR
jgi:ribose transport system permease protein